MNTKTIVILSVMTILAVSFVLIAESEDSDATSYSESMTVDSSYTGYLMPGTYTSGSIPGMSISTNIQGGIPYVYANGTPTTAGTYTIYATSPNEADTNTCTVTVSSITTYNYALYYSANGGSGAPSTQTYTSTSSSTHYFTISNTQPTRSSYTFLGWSESSSASTASYHGGDSIGVSANSQKNLYAVWQYNAPTTYTCYLYYNANNGSGAPSTQTYTGTSTSNHTFTISNTIPTRTDYNFLGWSESSSASTASYHGGDTISVAYNGSKTLYAVWASKAIVDYTANLTVTVSFAGYLMPGSYTSGSIPGMTLSTADNAGLSYVYANGTPTTAGTYTILADSPDNTKIHRCTVSVYNAEDFTCYLYYDANNGSGAPSTQSYTGMTISDHTFTISNTIPTRTDYNFLGWSESSSASTASYHGGDTISVAYNGSKTLYAVWQSKPIVNSSANLTVGDAFTGYLMPGTYTSGSIPGMSISTTESGGIPYVYANGTPTTAGTYVILGDSPDGTKIHRCTVVVSEPNNITYWSNDLYNGSVSIAFRFTGGNSNMDHVMNISLCTGVVGPQNQTVWTETGDYLIIEISYYPQLIITACLYDSDDVSLLAPSTNNLGSWKDFVLTIDANKGQLNYVPIEVFNDYTNFTTMAVNQKTLYDWSSITDSNSIYEIKHSDTGSGQHVNFSVTNTSTFLNTYGVILTDPSINVFDYFPQYEDVRLNFFSFAIYGDSMTVNGVTFPVTDGKVSFYYTKDGTTNTIANQTDEGASSATFTLSNIYVTWQDGKCSLTFVDDDWTLQLGTFSAGSETVSFSGFWYFTSYLYEPYTITEKKITGDWQSVPDIGGPAMMLVFLGTLIVGGLIAHVKLGLKWLDMIIVLAGAVMSFTLLG